jgi:FkbM family methyltransferase
MLRHTLLFPFEPEIKFVGAFLDRGLIAVDVGANVGIYTSVLSRHAGKVYAFEPHPACVAQLRRIRIPYCEVIAAAVSNHAGEAILHVPVAGNGEWHALSTVAAAKQWDGRPGIRKIVDYRVPCTTLDAALLPRLASGDRIGLVKIDVEGHELAVLEGATGILARDRPTFLIECEFDHDAPVETTFAFLNSRDYRAFTVKGRGALEPVDADRLRSLQPAENIGRKRAKPRFAGYVNNVFFVPAERGLPHAAHGA